MSEQEPRRRISRIWESLRRGGHRPEPTPPIEPIPFRQSSPEATVSYLGELAGDILIDAERKLLSENISRPEWELIITTLTNFIQEVRNHHIEHGGFDEFVYQLPRIPDKVGAFFADWLVEQEIHSVPSAPEEEELPHFTAPSTVPGLAFHMFIKREGHHIEIDRVITGLNTPLTSRDFPPQTPTDTE